MDLRDTIRSTGSVREFTDEPVPDELVADILDDARFAPSGGNRQPWRVVSVRDAETRRLLGELTQPIWNEYWASQLEGGVPFNSVDYRRPTTIEHVPNPLVEQIETIPAVLVVAADLRRIVAMDRELDRTAIVPGASIYPFCWNILLAARARGLGGVLTTFLAKEEPVVGPRLHLPGHHAIAAVVFLGRPVHQPTRLRREAVTSFATIDTFDGPTLG